jgi:hypothetical protein
MAARVQLLHPIAFILKQKAFSSNAETCLSQRGRIPPGAVSKTFDL